MSIQKPVNTTRLASASTSQPTQTGRANNQGSRIKLRILVPLSIIIGFIAALSIMREVSSAYSYYIENDFWNRLQLNPFVACLLFVAAIALLVYAIWSSSRPARPPFWRGVDFMLAAFLTVHFVVLCFALVWAGAQFEWGFLFPFASQSALEVLSFLVCFAPLALLAEGIARLRDSQLSRTCYWLQLFKHYPLNTPLGLVMALALAAAFFTSFVPFVHVNWYGFRGMSLLLVVGVWVFPLAMLAVLSAVCYYLLTLAARYEAANREKLQAERFKSELITNVSHDIRAPLTAIVSYVDLLGALPVENPHFKEYVEVLSKKSARLKTLTSDLMEASKASTGNLSVELGATNLAEIVGQIAGEFDDQFEEKKLTLVFDPPARPVIVQADTRHLWRILENLFSNAAKYALPATRVFAEITFEEGTVVGSSATGGAVAGGAFGEAAAAGVEATGGATAGSALAYGGAAFSLKNTSEDPLEVRGEELIEQFIRGDRARNTEGNGLGLYIAKSLTELIGARFRIHTTGDLFEVQIHFGESSIR